MCRLALCLGIVALAMAASGPSPAAPPRQVVEDGGGCGICRFYGVDGFAVVNQNVPFNTCKSALGPYSRSVACSGWSYWDRTRVWKRSGGSIRVGFWFRSSDNLPTMSYRIYNSPYWNGQVLTVDRTERGDVPAYNVSTCAYDYTYGGDESSVLCEAIDW